jgi:uncharacterized protein DUF4231
VTTIASGNPGQAHTSQIAVATLAAFVLIAKGFDDRFRFRDNWLRYANAAVKIDIERADYQARMDDYSSAPNPLALLQERVRQIRTSEYEQLVRSMTIGQKEP